MLLPLSDLTAMPAAIAPAVSIPIWDQYVDFLKYVLGDLLADNLKSGGLAIVVFTVLVKTLLLPLTIKSTRSSKAMQELQPKIAELKKKYGKDRQEMSARTMELYRQYQVNPMAGCLPVLIQIPIFFGVYSAISSLSNAGEGHFADSFLWLPDLGEADPFKILPFVAAGFQFVQTKMMRPANQGKITDPQQAMMNTMMNFMPLMVVVFGWNFDSGPVIYWVAQSVYSVVQQWFITGWGSLSDWIPGLPELPEHRRLGYRPPRDLDDVVVMSGAALPPRSGFMGWMDKRMEEAQRQQAERMKAAAERAGGANGSASTAGAAEARSAKGARPVKRNSPAARAKRSSAHGNTAAPHTADAPNDGGSEPEPVSVNGSRPRAVPRKSRASRPPDES